MDGLRRLLSEAEIPASVVGEPALFDVYFGDVEIVDYRSTLKADTDMLGRFNELLLRNGIFKGASKYYLSTAHDAADVAKTLEAFALAIDELRG